MAANRSVSSTGFIVLDLLAFDDVIQPHVGGTAANVAVNLAALGWDASVSGLLGADAAGRLIVEELSSLGVNVDNVTLSDDVETPIVIHEVRRGRHRFRFSCPICGRRFSKHRPVRVEDAALVSRADVFFFDRSSRYAIEAARRQRALDATVVFEPGSPGRLAAAREAVLLVDVLRYSSESFEQFRDFLPEDPGPLEVVGKGPDGVAWRGTWAEECVETWHEQAVPSELKQVIDAGGAGDWLTAVLIDSLSRGVQTEVALMRAQEVAAVACGFIGTRGCLSDVQARNLIEKIVPVKLREVSREVVSSRPPMECEDWFCIGG